MTGDLFGRAGQQGPVGPYPFELEGMLDEMHREVGHRRAGRLVAREDHQPEEVRELVIGIAPCHDAAIRLHCGKCLVIGLDVLHIYELALHFAAISAPISMAPCHHSAPSLQCCKGVVWWSRVLHIIIFGLVLLLQSPPLLMAF